MGPKTAKLYALAKLTAAEIRHALVLIVAILLAVVGCAETATRVVVRAPPQASELVLLVVSSDTAGFAETQALADTLVRAGYQVTRDQRQPHDATLRLALPGHGEEYRATLEILGGASLRVDGREPEFASVAVSEDGNLVTLVNDFTNTRGLALAVAARQLRLTTEADAARARAEAEIREQEDLAERHRQEQESAWEASGKDECAAPSNSRSCDALQAYVSANPATERESEAREILRASEPRIIAYRDDERWTAARADDCITPKAEDACIGVRLYLVAFPEGRHATEARKAETRGAPVVARLRARAQARDDAEATPAGHYDPTSNVPASGGGTVHVRGYTRKNGTYVQPYTRRPPRR